MLEDRMTANTTSSPIGLLDVEGVRIEAKIVGDQVSCSFRGQITSRQPDAAIAPYLRRVHTEAVRVLAQRVIVDVTELSFVNSSGIRLFVDWAMWAKNDGKKAYSLVFRTKEQVTWQRMTLVALTALAPDVVEIVPT
jgi:hypothetical protein